jgi:hypothetical protein
LKGVFAKHPTGNPDFTAEIEYDAMIKDLTGEAEKLLQKRDKLPF